MASSIRFVLLRPRLAENVGAVARALKNCGVEDWGWIDAEFDDLEPARKLAVHAEDVLEKAQRFASLHAAIADCEWVVGTSSRTVRGKRRMSPRGVAEEAQQRVGTVAIVFGDERSGMRNDEVDHCHDLSAIPTAPAQPSVNLAQAVLVYAYECRIAQLAGTAGSQPPRATAATHAELADLEAALEATLTASDFLSAPGRHAIRDLVAPLRRARLTRAEVKLWRAAVGSLSKRIK